MKAKKIGCPQITAQSCVFSLSPLFFDWGAVFGKCLNFFCEQFILWICLLVQNISFGSFDKILCKTCLAGNSLQTNFRFWHLIVWLDKFKLEEDLRIVIQAPLRQMVLAKICLLMLFLAGFGQYFLLDQSNSSKWDSNKVLNLYILTLFTLKITNFDTLMSKYCLIWVVFSLIKLG